VNLLNKGTLERRGSRASRYRAEPRAVASLLSIRNPGGAIRVADQTKEAIHANAAVLSLAIALNVVAPASSQEYRGTWEQQMACTPDVWRLCADQIPDVSRIVTCLRQNTPQLSNNCRAVFESNAEQQRGNRGSMQRVPQQTTPRSRAPQQMRPQPRPFYEEDE
jgi:hypothetical protein